MAAFERVSKIVMVPEGRESMLDVRTARLPSRTPSIGEFDPRDYRTPTEPIKMWLAYFNIVRIGFGPGLLGMPLAISQAGMLFGPVMCMAIGGLLLHTHLVLLWSLTEIARQLHLPYISYRYGFRMALLRGPNVLHGLGRRGPAVIAAFMLMSQIGICTVFVIFITDSIRDICDWPSSKNAYYVMFIPLLLLEVLLKSFKYISYLAMAGNFMNATGVILVFYHIFKSPRKEVEVYTQMTVQYLFAMGNMLFCGSFVGVILATDKSLIRPRKMTACSGPVVVAMSFITIMSTIFGTLGYWAFGTMEENVLRSLPFDDDSTMVGIALYMTAVALTYPLQCYPGTNIILEVIKNADPNASQSESGLQIVEYIIRPTFILITFFIAYQVPFQGPFVALVGNLCTTMISVVFPAMMELSLKYPDNFGKYHYYLVKNLLIILLGTISWIVGVVLSGHIIYVRILAKYSPNDREFWSTVS